MSLYKRGKYYAYNFLWNGRKIQGSTGVANRNAARTIEAAERVKLEMAARGLVPEKDPNPTIKEMFDRLEQDFKRRSKWSRKQESNFRCVRRMFPAESRAKSITTQDVEHYVDKRQKKGRRNATINRMTLLLSQAYKLAEVKEQYRPKVKPLYVDDNARRGFFEADQFARVLQHLPEDLHDFCRFAYITGARKSEIAGLKWRNVEGDLIRWYADETKNGEPRCVPLNIGDLQAIIKRRREARQFKVGETVQISQWIFHRKGEPIQEFRKSWSTACEAAQVPDRLFHDFRRTAVRNLRKAGVPEAVAMAITGHKTKKVFQRYNIVDTEDKCDAMQKVQTFLEIEAAKVSKMIAAQ